LFLKHISLTTATAVFLNIHYITQWKSLTEKSDGKAHGKTALIKRSSIRHYEILKYQRKLLQITLVVED